MINIAHAPLESHRFNLHVYRGRADGVEPAEIIQAAMDHRIDVIIFRTPAAHRVSVAALTATGFDYYVADTLVYYHADLKRQEVTELRNPELEFIPLTPEWFSVLDDLVSRIFVDYRNHYHVNPLFQFDLTDAYQEWARSFGEENAGDRQGWIVTRDREPIGFATCSHETTTCEGVLYGVLPEAAGGGVYTDIIRYTQDHYRNRGFQLMKVSTQVDNFAVQKVWSREGFVMKEALLTVHVNCLMRASSEFGQRISQRYRDTEGSRPLRTGLKHFPTAAWDAMLRTLEESFPDKRLVLGKGNFISIRGTTPETDYDHVLHIPVLNPADGVGKARLSIIGPDGQPHLVYFLDFSLK